MNEAARSLPQEPHAQALSGRYTLREKLGEGGMGVVYRATDLASGQDVALKQLLSSMAGAKRASAEALFEREYHALVRVKHPRIIEVYDYGRTDEGPFYTMELLLGEDLVKAAPLPYQDVCRHMRDIASSLALVHAQRWVHRDVSPRNVRLTHQGRAKLIDFGALAAFGPHLDIVGTPTCMAPEILHSQPLDQRTDLFALGAVAYWALTRRNAYLARRVHELSDAWKTPPVPPSRLVPEIPPELDALVLSLLSLDPMARPTSAAAVIDALSVIGQLEPEDHEQSAEHYLHSGRFVGRANELAFVERALTRALKGTGSEIVVDGAAGIGKTRLLREAAVEAQVKGFAVLRADALTTAEPFGLATALGLRMLHESPELARHSAGAHAPLLSRLSPELHAQLGRPELSSLSTDHAERRARMQTALHEWFSAFVRERPVLLAIDNFQAADDNSAAFLAALGRNAKRERQVLLVTQRTGERTLAPLPVKALRRRANHIKLGSLSQEAVQELVESLFGRVENTGRLARLLFERSAGNPQHCMDLAQILVKKQIAKYVGGTWVLPVSISVDELPGRSDEITALKLAALGDDAKKLVEALSVHTKPLPLEQCLKLLPDTPEHVVFGALDELVAEQVLCGEDGQYRFVQNTLREAVLLQMGEEERRALHQRAASTLLSHAEPSIGQRIEAAWHLMRAGEETRGADLMATAGREFLRTQSTSESPAQVVEALRTAAAVYERERRSEYEMVPLLSPLVALGFHLDWHATLKYGEQAIDMALRITGLTMAQKLSRYLGRKLGLIVALIIAGARFREQRKRGLNVDLKQTIGSLLAMVPACVGTHSICYDLETVRRLLKKLEPLRLFGDEHVAALLYDFATTQALMNEGRELEARRVLERLVTRFEAPHVAQAFGEGHYKSIFGGILFSLGVVCPYEFGTKTLTIAERLDTLGVRIWAMGADQLRLLHYAFRGESEEVQRYRDRVELYAVQGSNSWQAEVFWPVLLLTSEALAGDTIGVRRLAEQLARRAVDVPGLLSYAEAAQAIYLNLRGNHAEAIAAFEKVMPEIPPRGRVAWHTIRAFYADALNRAGDHQRAKHVAEEVLANAIPGEEAIVVRFLEPLRQLALAEAGLSNYASAVQTLDNALERHKGQDNHLLLGLLHKARAEVAFNLKDADAVDAHLTEMGHHFHATRNPAAVAQWERTLERLQRPERVSPPGALSAPIDALSVLTQKIQSELYGAADPFARALAMVVGRAHAKAGHLYVLKDERLSLVSATGPLEPPPELEQLLMRRIQRIEVRTLEELSRGALDEAGEEVPAVTAIYATEPPPSESAHQLFVLTTSVGGAQSAVGGLILETGADAETLEQDFIDAIACGLADLLVNTATTF